MSAKLREANSPQAQTGSPRLRKFFLHPARIPPANDTALEAVMNEPKSSRPYWPDFADMPKDPAKGLKDWTWALERSRKITQLLDRHHTPGWTSSSHAGLGCLVGRRLLVQHRPEYAKSKKHRRACLLFDRHRARRRSRHPRRHPQEVIRDRAVWKRLAAVYNKKYGGDVEPLLKSTAATSIASSLKPPSARTNTPPTSPNPSPAGASRKLRPAKANSSS